MNTQQTQKYIKNETIAELVAKDYRKAEVFKKFGIDFCCGGKRTPEDVCREKQIDFNELREALAKTEQTSSSGADMNFNDWELDELVDYIINVHHKYVRENIPLLQEFTGKVSRVHGTAHPEVVKIAEIFAAVAQEMTQHMMKEEHILFPYIKQLVVAEKNRRPMGAPPFSSVENPIRMMESEHDHAGNLVKQIRQLSNEFTPPENACNTYQVTYHKLREFEEDLHKHIHLENNILFPKAIALEGRLQNVGV